MAALYSHVSRATGTILTAAIYNGDHENHITFGDAQYLGGWSSNVTQMRTVSDPGESGSESLAASISDELERLRFAILKIKQGLDSSVTYWYETAKGAEGGVGRLPPRYVQGLEMRVYPAAGSYIYVSPGSCRSEDDAVNLTVSARLHRTVTALWTTAATAGGAAVTWVKFQPYHVFVFKTAASTVDIGFDSVLTASNLMARASATHYRRIGSIQTATTPGNMMRGIQRGREYCFDPPRMDNPSFTAVVPTGIEAYGAAKLPPIPTGIRVKAHVRAWATGAVGRFALHHGVTEAGLAVSYTRGEIAFTVSSSPQEGEYWTTPSGDLRYVYFGSGDGVNISVLSYYDPLDV